MKPRPLSLRAVYLFLGTIAAASASYAQEIRDGEYFHAPGADVLVFSNWYDGLFSDAKISGVEVIHHGLRTVTNGDVRLEATPGQWEPVGSFIDRRIERAAGVIEADLAYPDHDFNYTVRVERDGNGYVISVSSETPLPASLEGKAGFNLEFVPSTYGGKGLLVDGAPQIIPYTPVNAMVPRDGGPRPDGASADPLPIAEGQTLVLAPGSPADRVSLSSRVAPIALYDGRNQASNGWYVARSLLPAGKTGRLIEWRLEVAEQPGWVSPPVVSYNQLGYTPARSKVAILQLDRDAGAPGTMHLDPPARRRSRDGRPRRQT